MENESCLIPMILNRIVLRNSDNGRMGISITSQQRSIRNTLLSDICWALVGVSNRIFSCLLLELLSAFKIQLAGGSYARMHSLKSIVVKSQNWDYIPQNDADEPGRRKRRRQKQLNSPVPGENGNRAVSPCLPVKLKKSKTGGEEIKKMLPKTVNTAGNPTSTSAQDKENLPPKLPPKMAESEVAAKGRKKETGRKGGKTSTKTNRQAQAKIDSRTENDEQAFSTANGQQTGCDELGARDSRFHEGAAITTVSSNNMYSIPASHLRPNPVHHQPMMGQGEEQWGEQHLSTIADAVAGGSYGHYTSQSHSSISQAPMNMGYAGGPQSMQNATSSTAPPAGYPASTGGHAHHQFQHDPVPSSYPIIQEYGRTVFNMDARSTGRSVGTNTDALGSVTIRDTTGFKLPDSPLFGKKILPRKRMLEELYRHGKHHLIPDIKLFNNKKYRNNTMSYF